MTNSPKEGDPAEKNITPEPVPTERHYLLDRYEGSLIVVLLVLVAGTQFWDQWVPSAKHAPIGVVRGAESKFMDPVDLQAVSTPRPLPARDVNTVSRGELLAINGIGPAMAEAILRYREQHGPFTSLEELLGIPGIGPKRLKQFSQYLRVPGEHEAGKDAPLVEARSPEDSPSAQETREEPLNLNEADREQLMRIPGIGEKFADRILEQRSRLKKFRNWSDLDAVPGVGPKRLENLKAHATIE